MAGEVERKRCTAWDSLPPLSPTRVIKSKGIESLMIKYKSKQGHADLREAVHDQLKQTTSAEDQHPKTHKRMREPKGLTIVLEKHTYRPYWDRNSH